MILSFLYSFLDLFSIKRFGSPKLLLNSKSFCLNDSSVVNWLPWCSDFPEKSHKMAIELLVSRGSVGRLLLPYQFWQWLRIWWKSNCYHGYQYLTIHASCFSIRYKIKSNQYESLVCSVPKLSVDNHFVLCVNFV